MLITEKDKGKYYLLENGAVVSMYSYIHHVTYPVRCRIIKAEHTGDKTMIFTEHGGHTSFSKSIFDIKKEISKDEMPEYFL